MVGGPMSKQPGWLFVCVGVILPACSGEDDEICGTPPSLTLDNPSPRATGVALELSGTMSSKVRLKSVTIGEVAVTGTDNYSSWRVSIPAGVIEDHRHGDKSMLPVSTLDACDKSSELSSIPVKSEAEAGTPVEDLQVTLDADDCFLPADGSIRTAVLVSGAEASAGVRVALTASAGTLLGTRDSDRTVVLAVGNTGAEARAFLHTTATSDARVSVTANAGTSFAYTPSYPVAVAPRYVGPSSLTNGKPGFINVLTAGRLKSCAAASTVSGSAIFTFGAIGPKEILNEGAESLDVDDCNQAALFQVEFDMATPVGAVLTLTCIDQLAQTSSYLMTSQGDPPSSGDL
jgi:hypothetical protein